MSSSDSIVLKIASQIQSQKVTDRKKGYDALSSILSQKLRFKDPYDVWLTLFNSINSAICHICDKLSSDATSSNATQIQSKQTSSSFLQEVLITANKGHFYISGKTIISQFLDLLSSRRVLNHCGDVYFITFLKIFPIANLFDDVDPIQWIELFDFCAKLIRDSASNIDLITLVQVLKFVIENGCKRSELALSFPSFLPALVPLYNRTNLNKSKNLQEEVFNLTILICREITLDFPRTVCKFGEEIIDNLILFYDPSDTILERKAVLFCLLNLIVEAHHHKGSTICSKIVSYKEENWWTHLDSLYNIVTAEIKILQSMAARRKAKTIKVPHNFIVLAVNICKQLFWNKRQNKEEPNERPAKRVCLRQGLDNFTDLILCCSGVNWIWFDVLAELLTLYTDVLHYVNAKLFLEMISEIQKSCCVEEHVESLYKCIKVLSNSTIFDSNECEVVWRKICENVCRMVSLNEFETPSNRCVQSLIHNGKCSQKELNILLKAFISGNIHNTADSIDTLLALLKMSTDNTEFDTNAKILLKWLLPKFADTTIQLKQDALKIRSDARSTSELSVRLILNTFPEVPNVRKTSIESRSKEKFSNWNISKLILDEIEYDSLNDKNDRCIYSGTNFDPLFSIIYENCHHLLAKMDSCNSSMYFCKLSLQYLLFISNILNEIVNQFEISEDLQRTCLYKMFCAVLREMTTVFEKISKNYGGENLSDVINIFDILKMIFDESHTAAVQRVIRETISLKFIEALYVLNTKYFTISDNKDEDAMEIFDRTEETNDKFVFHVIPNIENLSGKQQGRCTFFCVLANFTLAPSKNCQGVLNELCSNEFDVQTSAADFYIFSEVAKLMTQSTELTQNHLEWILTHMQKMCKGHFKNPDATKVILNLLKSLLPLVNRFNISLLRNNTVIMLFSFMTQCSRASYGPDVSVEMLECLKVLVQVDPVASWSKTRDGQSLFTRVPKYLGSNFLSIRLAAAKCLSSLFNIQLHKISSFEEYIPLCDDVFVGVRLEILGALSEQSQNEEEIVYKDSRETKILSSIHVLAAISAVNSKYRCATLLELLDLHITKKINIDLIRDALNLIAGHLHTSTDILLKTYMPYVLANWKRDFSEFPKQILNFDTDKEFFSVYQNQILAPIMSGNKLEAFCYSIRQTPSKVLKENSTSAILLWLLYDAVEDSRTQRIFQDISNALSEEEIFSRTIYSLDDIILSLSSRISDSVNFLDVFGWIEVLPDVAPPQLTRKQFVDTVAKVHKSGESFISFVCQNHPNKLQNILTSIIRRMYTSFSLEEKLMNFHSYSIITDLISEELKSQSDLQNMGYYLIRDIIYTLTNIINNNSEKKLCKASLIYLHKFTETILPSGSRIFQKFLKFIVATVATSACGPHKIELLCTDYLEMLLIEKQKCLEPTITQVVDLLPSHSIFESLKKQLKRMQGSNTKTLEQQMESFMDITDINVEHLCILKKSLSSEKHALGDLFGRLHNLRGFSEDCSKSILHRLVCYLVDLTASKNPEVCLEAAECLGEIGPADLTTMMLSGESTRNVSNLVTIILSELSVLLTDSNIEVVHSTCEALYAIFESREGIDWLRAQKKNNDKQSVMSFQPFITMKIVKTNNNDCSLKPRELAFINLPEVWTPIGSCDHKEWLVRLVVNILKSFSKNSFLYCLIPICEAKLSFTEILFPLLIRQIINCKDEVFNTVIGAQLQNFFQRHFTYAIKKKSDDVAGLQRSDSSLTENSKDSGIFLNKASVQSMLNVVETIRLEVNFSNTMTLNYLHVAHAAKWNAAYFTSILYCELWAQHVFNNGMGKKSLSKPLDALTNMEDGRHVQNILRECYVSLGDTDAVYGCTSSEMYSLHQRIEHYKHVGLWNRVTLYHDLQLSMGCQGHQRGLAESLQKTGLFYLSGVLSQNIVELDASHFESAWRLGQWTLNTNSYNNNAKIQDFARNHYASLKSLTLTLGIFDDKTQVSTNVKKARLNVIDSLQHVSRECSKRFYKYAMRLRMLQEIQDVSGYLQMYLTSLLDKWTAQDLINHNDFEYVEPIWKQRAVILNNAFVEKKILACEEPLIDILLRLACRAYTEGYPELSVRNLGLLSCLDLTPHLQGQCVLLEAKLSWESGDKEPAKILLSRLIRDPTQAESINRCTALKLYGDWLVETRSENARVIIEDYFTKSLEGLHELSDQDHSGQAGIMTSRLEVFKSMALFADAQYKQVNEYMQSAIYENKKRCMSKSREMVHSLTSQRHLPGAFNQDERIALRIHDQQSKIDKAEIENTESERLVYLTWAMKYYIAGLREGDADDLKVFRVVSLWLDNNSELQLTRILRESLAEIPTYKFLPVLPQLAPRLEDGADAFSAMLTDLLVRCAISHPHHTLPILMSLAHAHQDKENNIGLTSSQEPRILAAQKLIDGLRKKKPLCNMIKELESVSLALISFANYTLSQEQIKKGNQFKTPRGEPITRLKNLMNTHVPTLDLPVRKNGVYNDIISVVSWDDSFTMVGGINAPKKMICRGSDGVPRPQLLKGKDDLRQDAVMQQVFTIMNDLLRRNKETKKRKLLIRTYKVVPLSQRSGIIEWCVNTVPLGMYLIGADRLSGAHTKYRPNDMKPKRAHDEFSSIASHSNNEKLRMFLNICDKMEPVFQHFFIENFPTPTVWFERRQAYTHSVATSSMVGYILGLGDRHIQNILVDKNTAELIHIDFGIAFEQGRVLPTPETVPFRLTRDVIAGMGVTGIEGVFRRCCEKSMLVLRQNQETILTILEVLLYDPLYAWTVTPRKAYNRQRNRAPEADLTTDTSQTNTTAEVNKMAERALMRLQHKLQGTEEGGGTGMSSVEGQVGRLIQQATDPSNLCRLFVGWQPYL